MAQVGCLPYLQYGVVQNSILTVTQPGHYAVYKDDHGLVLWVIKDSIVARDVLDSQAAQVDSSSHKKASYEMSRAFRNCGW